MDVDTIPVRPAHGNTVDSLGGKIAPQSSPLAAVPIEVLLQINRHLTTPEYGNLRLTCKHIEDQLLLAFAKEFFKKRQFMFTEFSLQAFIDISKSRFGSNLKHVIFGLEQPSTSIPLGPPPTFQATHPPDLAQKNRLTMDWFNHSSFLDTGRNVEMLAEAFSALPSLETIGMRDFNSRSRFRDAPHTAWNSKFSLVPQVLQSFPATLPKNLLQACTLLNSIAYLLPRLWLEDICERNRQWYAERIQPG